MGLCPTKVAIVANKTLCGGCRSWSDCMEEYKLLPGSSEENCMYDVDPSYECRIDASRLFMEVPLKVAIVVAVIITGILVVIRRKDKMVVCALRALCCFVCCLVWGLLMGECAVSYVMATEFDKMKLMSLVWYIRLGIDLIVLLCSCVCCGPLLGILFSAWDVCYAQRDDHNQNQNHDYNYNRLEDGVIGINTTI